MKQKKSISSPKKGMNRDSHLSQLQGNEYSLAVNANTNSEQEGFNITNESSNYLGVNFPTGYKVIGFKNYINKERTLHYYQHNL